MCELCQIITDETPLWEDDVVFITQKGRIILKRHGDDCTKDEWSHIWDLFKKMFKNADGYRGHDTDHFHIDVITE